jgi:hypothetical protein
VISAAVAELTNCCNCYVHYSLDLVGKWLKELAGEIDERLQKQRTEHKVRAVSPYLMLCCYAALMLCSQVMHSVTRVSSMAAVIQLNAHDALSIRFMCLHHQTFTLVLAYTAVLIGTRLLHVRTVITIQYLQRVMMLVICQIKLCL